MSKEVPKKSVDGNNRVQVLYRYEDEDDRALFERYFSRDFDISLSCQQELDPKQFSLSGSAVSNFSDAYSAMVLDGDQLDLQFAKDVRDRHSLFCAQLHRNIELGDIVKLLEKGLVDKFYAKPYDPNVLRSDILASSLNLSQSIQSYALNYDEEQELAVLLVDDEEVATRFLIKHLERLSCPATLYVASSAEEALELVEQLADKLAVVISDQRMPGMQGNQLLASLNQTNPHIIRILTSAYNEVDIALNAVNEGRIFRYIQKPWVASEINDLIKVSLFEFRSAMKKAANASLAIEQEYVGVLEERRDAITNYLLNEIAVSGFATFLSAYFDSLNELQLLPVTQGVIRAARETAIEGDLQKAFVKQLLTRMRTAGIETDNVNNSLNISLLERIAAESLSNLASVSDIDISSYSKHESESCEYETLIPKGTHPWLYKHILCPISQISDSFIAAQVDLIILAWCYFQLRRELKFNVDSAGVSVLVRQLEMDDG